MISLDPLMIRIGIEQLVINQIIDEQEELNGGRTSWEPRGRVAKNIILGQRPKSSMITYKNIPTDDWTFPPHSGEERMDVYSKNKLRVTIIQMPIETFNAPVRVLTRVDDDRLRAHTIYELAPFGSGPFDILPERSITALQQRRDDIQEIYNNPLRNATP